MYFGYYEHSLDDKGRLMIPAKLREGLLPGSPLYILRGFDGCVSVYSEEAFHKLEERLLSLPYEDKEARSMIRNILGSVVALNVDKLGRIQLPTLVLNKYHISHNVVVLGVGNHFEIWDFDIYQAYEEGNSQKFEDIADQLVKRS